MSPLKYAPLRIRSNGSARKWITLLLILAILFMAFPVTSTSAAATLKCSTLIKSLAKLQPGSPKYDQVWNLVQTNCGYEIDHTALLALYNSTDGANWTTPWANLNSDHCAWGGILCDETGRVMWVKQTDNNLNGTIPPQLDYMINLRQLYLPGNSLSGQIPAQLGNLANLIVLGLFDNQLSGPIPPELDNLANLYWLDLSYNQLTGPIPSGLGELTMLERIGLNSNLLTGSIPPELGNLPLLKLLDLTGNQLTGPIPPELGNLPALDILNLGYNQLSGSIPRELGNLSELEWLTLDNNLLTGIIPADLSNLSQLWLLWLGSPDLGCWETPEALAWALNLTDYQGPTCCVTP